jgi:soluble lytic murein transglycosylase-like protein
VKIFIKLFPVFCSLLSLCFLIGLFVKVFESEYKKTEALTKEFEKFKEEKEAPAFRIDVMERTLLLVYNHISKYEAHYFSIIFDDFSEKNGVPWTAYAALVRIESNFNPTTVSPARCKGLTQCKESTAKEVAEKLGITYNDATLWNDILNVIIGLTYFSDGFKERKDSLGIDEALKHAMKRYCGGPGYQRINFESKIYVGEYKSTLWQEYVRLSYVYKGVLYEAQKKKGTPSSAMKQKNIFEEIRARLREF